MLPSRLPANDGGPLIAGIAAGIVLGPGVVVQAYARRRHLGPGAGVVGGRGRPAAGRGRQVAARPGRGRGAFLLLGAGDGLWLRAGLLDLERWAAPAGRGTLAGLFYLATDSGFAVPVALAALEPTAGPTLPLLVLGRLGRPGGVLRWMRITRIRA